MPIVHNPGSNLWSDSTTLQFASDLGTMPTDALATSKESEDRYLWLACVRRLLELRELPDDWDGEGAEAPRPEVVDSAIEYVELRLEGLLPPPARIAASPSGAVIMEWQLGKSYLEIEIAEPHMAEWMLEQAGAEPEHLQDIWGPPTRDISVFPDDDLIQVA